jgi:quinohemoprotein amine dehydrogenase
MSTRTRIIFALGLLLPVLPLLGAEQPAPQARSGAVTVAEGIPVLSAEVRQACGTCHVSDEKNMMSRISYRRATPENWELTIKRMMALNGAPVTPDQARAVLKYLADNHGLAPEEARPIMFEADRSMVDFTYEANADTHNLCSKCHSMGRVLSERRTPDEWGLLISMHRGVYPGIDGGSGGFRRGGGGGANAGRAGGRGGNATRQPMDLAVEHLRGAFPLMSTEWAAWSAAMPAPRLAGKWALTGHESGKGPVAGEVTVTAQPGTPDGFVTTTTFTYLRTGETVTRTGRGLVYTGFQWRGRSSEKAENAAAWREVALIERDQNQISGRWFTGDYAERGMTVTLRRVGRDALVTRTDVASLKTGTAGQTVRIYGANLPVKLAVTDVVFGQGVTVSRVTAATPTMATVVVDVAADARVGPRDVSVTGASRPAALTVYDRVDTLKVLPLAGMARLGGIVFPKQYQQFEAVAFNNGPDRLPNTADDLDLGMVDATWKVEEYAATFKEDDVAFVGTLSPTGLFTPNVDGPNADRTGNRNNMGDVWVVAEYTPAGAAPIRGRAHLLVTVPLYMNWDSTEVGK